MSIVSRKPRFYACAPDFPTETGQELQSTIDQAARSSFPTAALLRVIPFKGVQQFSQVEQAGQALPTDGSAHEPYKSEINSSAVDEERIFALRKQACRRSCMNPKRRSRIFGLIPQKRSMPSYLARLLALRAYAR